MPTYIALGVAVVLALGCATGGVRQAAVPPSPASTPRAITWNPETGLLSCGDGETVLPIPAVFRSRVQVTKGEAVLALSDARAALMVTVGTPTPVDPSPPLLHDLPRVWADLHRLATGLDLQDGQLTAEMNLRQRGHVTVHYRHDVQPTRALPAAEPLTYRPSSMIELEDPHDTTWILDYIEAGRCRVAAIDRAEPHDQPRLIPLLGGLQIH